MAKPKQLAFLGEEEIGDTPDSVSRAAFSAWNDCAKQFGWVTCRDATLPMLSARLRKGVKDVGGLANWRKLLEDHGQSDFICGRTHTPGRKAFEFTVDWALKPANLIKLLNGNFLEEGVRAAVVEGKPAAVAAPSKVPQDPWQRWLSYRKGGWWPSHLGPKPDEPGCRMTPALLMGWRRDNHVEVVVPVQESRADRLAHTISRLRGMGQHERANRYEAELAALEGKPGTFVPHPSVADANKPSEAKSRAAVDPRMGHNRPPGPITDVDEDPGWDSVPEGDPAMAEP